MREDYRGAAAALTLGADLASGAVTFSVTGDTSGWPTGASGRPFTITIDRGKASEERMLCSSLTPTAVSVSQRGYDGTSDGNHTAGAAVEHTGPSATKMDDLDAHVHDPTRDDHLQYVPLDGSRGFSGLTAVAGTPGPVGGTVDLSGSANTLARSDHLHAIGLGGITDSAMFGPQVVNAAAIADASISAQKIVDGAVTATKIATGAVGPSKIILYFANAAARDAAIPSPIVGQQVFLTTTGEFLVYQGATVQWRPPWNLPWGNVASTSVTTAHNGFAGGPGDINGMTATFTAVANRIYRVTVLLPDVHTTSGGPSTNTLAITTAANTVVQTAIMSTLASTDVPWSLVSPGQVPGAGSITYKARMTTTGAINVANTASAIGLLMVDDIGPFGNPS